MTAKKPAKIKESRHIRAFGLASLLRTGLARPLARPAQVKTRSELIDEIDRCKERVAQAAGSGPLGIISNNPKLIDASRASEMGNT